MREAGLLFELVAAKLAGYFGIATPEPAIVTLEPELAELIAELEPSHAKRIRDSVGLNFGTKLLAGGSTWPVDKSIPEVLWAQAVNIFAFDALIQNPDRKFNNPNLLTKGDAYYAIDHEAAFSFILDILPSAAPWELKTQKYIEEHVFFNQLRHRDIEVNTFVSLLQRLTDDRFSALVGDVPPQWDNDRLSRIASHLRTMREHAAQFADEIRKRLV